MARGQVSLTISLDGRDQLTAQLQKAADATEKLGTTAKDSVETQASAWATLKGEITGLPGRMTDVTSAIHLATEAAKTFWEFLQGASDSAAINDVFIQNFQDAAGVLDDLKAATQGAVDETTLQKYANKLSVLGIAAKDMGEFARSAFVVSKSTGEEFKTVLEALAKGAATGTDSFKEFSAIAVDWKGIVEQAAQSAGRTADSFSELEKRQIQTSAAAVELKKRFGELQLSDAAVATDRLAASYENAKDSAQQWALALLGVHRAQATVTDTLKAQEIEKALARSKNIGDAAIEIATTNKLTAEQYRSLEAALRDHLGESQEIQASYAADALNKAIAANRNLARLQKEDEAARINAIRDELSIEEQIENSHADWLDRQDAETAAKAKAAAEARKNAGIAAAKAAAEERRRAYEAETAEMLRQIGASIQAAQDENERRLAAQREAIRRELDLMQLRTSLREANGQKLTAVEVAEESRTRELLQIQMEAIGELTDAESTALQIQLADARVAQAERDELSQRRIEQLQAEAAAVLGVGTAFQDASALASQVAPELGAAFSGLSETANIISQSWGDLSKGAPGVVASLGKVTASVIKNTTAQAAVRAVFELASGFASLFLNPAEAASHFTSAALFATLAGVSAAQGNTASGGSAAPQSSQAGSQFFQSGTGGQTKPSNVTYVIQGQLHGSLADASAATRRMTDRAAGFGFEGAFA